MKKWVFALTFLVAATLIMNGYSLHSAKQNAVVEGGDPMSITKIVQ